MYCDNGVMQGRDLKGQEHKSLRLMAFCHCLCVKRTEGAYCVTISRPSQECKMKALHSDQILCLSQRQNFP